MQLDVHELDVHVLDVHVLDIHVLDVHVLDVKQVKHGKFLPGVCDPKLKKLIPKS